MAQVRYMLFIAVIFAVALALSALLGGGQSRACLWAVIANAVAACAGFAPVILTSLYKPSVYPLSVLTAGVIRLLITAVGAVIILAFVEVGVLWFAAWLGFFYIAVLVAEVYFVVRRLNGQNGAVAS